MQHSVFLDLQSIGPEDLDLSRLHRLLPGLRRHDHTTPAQTAERIRDAEIIIVNKVPLDAALLHAAPRLRLIAVTATGTNNIDLDACRERGIQVANARNYGTESVAQHCFALMLALANRLLPYVEDVRAGRWSAQDNFCLLDHPIMQLRGRTLGIIGFGALGRAFGQLASNWGMQVLVGRRPAGDPNDPARLPLAELLERADVVSIHCLLSAETEGLIGAPELARMRPGSLLINTARGGIVDESALLQALQSGHLGGAALDVLGTEPPPGDHPLLQASLPNLLLTPHCAWASVESRQALMNQVCDNIDSWLAQGTARLRVC